MYDNMRHGYGTRMILTTFRFTPVQSMSMRGEPVLCTEILIDPRPLGREQPGLPTLVHSCISACPVDVQAELSCCVMYGHLLFILHETSIHNLYARVCILVCTFSVVGGSSSIPGLAQRLTSELRSLGTDNSRIKMFGDVTSKRSCCRPLSGSSHRRQGPCSM